MSRTKSDKIEFYGVRLLVRDFRKSWHFYRDRVGLTPLQGSGEPPYGEFVWKKGVVLSIFDRKLMASAVGLTAGRYAGKNVGRSAVILEVKDVDRFAAQLRRRKVRLLQRPTDRPEWGLRTIHFQDPDRYLVEVHSRLRRG